MQINVQGSGTLGVSVYDALGRQVFHTDEIDVQQGNNYINLQIPSLSPGIYFYYLRLGDKEKVLKYLIM